MEYLNKIELKGVVGRVETRTYQNGIRHTIFSLMTETTALSKDGTATIDTTWFNCTTIPTDAPLHGEIRKGDNLHVIGRVRIRKYTDAGGIERNIMDVLAQSIQVLNRTTEEK